MGRALEKTLAQKRMNRIYELLDENALLKLFQKELTPLFPDYGAVSRVTVKPYKKLIWETTYHVVIGFRVYFNNGQKERRVPIVCSAHSDEPRRNVYEALKYFEKTNFSGDGVDVPRPLFYSDYFRGTFYQEIEGENLLHYIKSNQRQEIESIILAAGKLFAKLHSLPTVGANINPQNALIKTVLPGVEVIFKEIADRYQDKYNNDLEKIYNYLMAAENRFRMKGQYDYVIHGDAHPENIIRTAPNRIGLIDFTDLCVGDFARDLGSFSQQLEYRIGGKLGDAVFATKMKDLFLSAYLEASNRDLTAELSERINIYYQWTAIRTATYWFLKFGHDENRANELLKKVKNNLGL